MRGKRSESKSLRQQGWDELEGMFQRGKGTSKHKDKMLNGGDPARDKIYVDSTLHDYGRKWSYFVDAMKEDDYKFNGHKPRTLDEAKDFLPRYVDLLKERDGSRAGTKMSASSIRSYTAAACKVLGTSMSDLDLPSRHTSAYTRSRDDVVRDKHFSEERNADLVEFCRCTGLRADKELRPLKGSQLEWLEDGSPVLRISGKGGRERLAPIVGDPDAVQRVVDRCISAGDGRVWEHVHNAADIHHYRAEYAATIYHMYAREASECPLNERYCCRGDKVGIWYDREALMVVSEALGHSRASVVAESYSYMF